MIYILAKHNPKEGIQENGMIRVQTMDTGQTLWVSPEEIVEKPFTEWGRPVKSPKKHSL